MSHFTVAVFTKTGTEEEVDRLLAPYQENNMGDCPKEYLAFVEDEDADMDEETGKRGYWENPNAKWDWYQIGGRWKGLLVSTKGTARGTPSLIGGKRYRPDEHDTCLTADIDFEVMEQRRRENLEPFETCFARKFYTPEYFNRLYPSEEAYIRANTRFYTHAVVTPDGAWHAKGEMGWWGMSSETPEEMEQFRDEYKERFIQPAIEAGWYLTIVDCHI